MRPRAKDQIDHVVVPGTFDPVTYGHLDVIMRASRLVPRVTVAVAASQGKNGTGPVFTLEERVGMVREALAQEGVACGPGERVDVAPLRGLLVAFCHEVGAGGVVKGLRATTDFEYELQQADLNARLAPDLESVFVMSSPELGFVSSSVVRELASLGGRLDLLVPPVVERRLRERYGGKSDTLLG